MADRHTFVTALGHRHLGPVPPFHNPGEVAERKAGQSRRARMVWLRRSIRVTATTMTIEMAAVRG